MSKADLRRARRRHELIGHLNLAGSIISVLLCLLLTTWWWRFSTRGFGGSALTDSLGVLAGSTALQSAAFLWATGRAEARPLLPSILVAVVSTLATLLTFLIVRAGNPTDLAEGGASLGSRLALFVPLAVTVLLWGLVGWAQRIESNPEFTPRPRRNAKPWAWHLSTGAFVLLGLFLLSAVLGRPSVDEEAVRFRDAWNADETETLYDYALSDDGPIRRVLDRMLETYPAAARPRFDEILRTDEVLGRPITVLHSPSLVLTLRWRLPHPLGGWKLVAMRRR